MSKFNIKIKGFSLIKEQEAAVKTKSSKNDSVYVIDTSNKTIAYINNLFTKGFLPKQVMGDDIIDKFAMDLVGKSTLITYNNPEIDKGGVLNIINKLSKDDNLPNDDLNSISEKEYKFIKHNLFFKYANTNSKDFLKILRYLLNNQLNDYKSAISSKDDGNDKSINNKIGMIKDSYENMKNSLDEIKNKIDKNVYKGKAVITIYDKFKDLLDSFKSDYEGLKDKFNKRTEEEKNKINDAKSVEDLAKSAAFASSIKDEKKQKEIKDLIFKKSDELGKSKEEVTKQSQAILTNRCLTLIDKFKKQKVESEDELNSYYKIFENALSEESALIDNESVRKELKGLLKGHYETRLGLLKGREELESKGIDPDKQVAQSEKEETETDTETKPEEETETKPETEEEGEVDVEGGEVEAELCTLYYKLTSSVGLPIGKTVVLDPKKWGGTPEGCDELGKDKEFKEKRGPGLGKVLLDLFGYEPQGGALNTMQAYAGTREAMANVLDSMSKNTLGLLAGTAAGTALAAMGKEDGFKKGMESGGKMGEDIMKFFTHEGMRKSDEVNPALVNMENRIRKAMGLKLIKTPEIEEKIKQSRTRKGESKLKRKLEENLGMAAGAPAAADANPGGTSGLPQGGSNYQTPETLGSSDPYKSSPATRDSDGSALAVQKRKKKKKKKKTIREGLAMDFSTFIKTQK